VLSFEVDALRPGAKDATVWDGFALGGETGARGVPEVLRGEYGEQGDGERPSIVLRWNAVQTSGAAGFAELSQVLAWLTGRSGE
jgi:hypothetical protein